MVAIITLINTRCAHCDGTINFVTQHVKVQEKQYEEATFYLKRESSTSGNVFFYCKVSQYSLWSMTCIALILWNHST